MQNSNIKPAFLRLRDVCAMTGLSRATIYRQMADGRFPQSVKLGERISAWPLAALEQWASERMNMKGE